MTVIVIIVVVLLATLLPKSDGDESSSSMSSYGSDVDWLYSPGSTKVKYFAVNTTIISRLARSEITIVVENSLDDCAGVRGMTLELPINARVKSLVTTSDTGCTSTSEVQTVEQAKETFEESASQGKPAALVEAYDLTNYQMSISIPPDGWTSVVLTVEELLRRRQGQVKFQVPFSPPNEIVDVVRFELKVEDPGMEDLKTALGEVYESQAIFEDSQIDPFSLPAIIEGSFVPSRLPEEGVVMFDGQCFEHLFSPTTILSTIGAMPRSLLFVIDVSGSMKGSKLDDAKAALSTIIDNLEDVDVFGVQTFSTAGTNDLWGPNVATADNKLDAVRFVYGLQAAGFTNIEEALVDGIKLSLETSSMASSNEDVVPVLLFLTDGQATSGITDPTRITRNVLLANEERGVKLFCLAFGADADFGLISAIALQNGGIAERVYDGYGDSAAQMEGFFWDEFGSVLLSNLNFEIKGSDKITTTTTTTKSSFPVLADGSEVVMRGLLAHEGSDGIEVATNADSVYGFMTWSTTSSVDNQISHCYQSFAHTRVKELLQFRDAANLIGWDMAPFTPLTSECTYDLASCAESEAVSTALAGGLVWPGLTALVTLEDTNCQSFSNLPMCYDDGMGDTEYEGAHDGGEYSNEGPAVPTAQSPSSWTGADCGSGLICDRAAASPPPTSNNILTCIWATIISTTFIAVSIITWSF